MKRLIRVGVIGFGRGEGGDQLYLVNGEVGKHFTLAGQLPEPGGERTSSKLPS